MTQIHPMYLPFSAAELGEHFVEVKGAGDPDRHARYYVKSAAHAHAQALAQRRERRSPGGAAARNLAETYGNEMQKDERFWVATALMSLYRSADRVDTFARLLGRDLPAGSADEHGLRDPLGAPEDLKLYFEVDLPAPVSGVTARPRRRDSRHRPAGPVVSPQKRRLGDVAFGTCRPGRPRPR